MGFYYLVELIDDIPESQGFVTQKDDPKIEYGWLPIEDMQNIRINPEFLKSEIFELDGKRKHFISKGI